tara:strand:+ start:535 stop:723 length:189 start_codon:yes stop_codon:yes gene_type:complete
MINWWMIGAWCLLALGAIIAGAIMWAYHSATKEFKKYDALIDDPKLVRLKQHIKECGTKGDI